MANENAYSFSNFLNFINNNFALLVMAIGVFVVGFVSGSMWTENKTLRSGVINPPVAGEQQLAAPEPAQPLSDADWEEVLSEPVFAIGDPNAPVTMVEFTDYQCPFCAQHFTQTYGQLVSKYVDSGQLRIVFRDQALVFHQNANSAAQLVRCAAEQDQAEAMHDELFTRQTEWSQLAGEALNTKYAELATAAGLNGEAMVSCVESGKYQAAVDADSALGNRIGAGGTPTFFIEKEPLVGALPLAEFERVIEEKLGN